MFFVDYFAFAHDNSILFGMYRFAGAKLLLFHDIMMFLVISCYVMFKIIESG